MQQVRGQGVTCSLAASRFFSSVLQEHYTSPEPVCQLKIPEETEKNYGHAFHSLALYHICHLCHYFSKVCESGLTDFVQLK